VVPALTVYAPIDEPRQFDESNVQKQERKPEYIHILKSETTNVKEAISFALCRVRRGATELVFVGTPWEHESYFSIPIYFSFEEQQSAEDERENIRRQFAAAETERK
jgi:hypothetical protein